MPYPHLQQIRETALYMLPWDFIFSLLESTFMDSRVPCGSCLGSFCVGILVPQRQGCRASCCPAPLWLPAHSSRPSAFSAVTGSRHCPATGRSHKPAILDPGAPSLPTHSVALVLLCSYLHTGLEMAVVPLHNQLLLLLAELSPGASADL